MTDTLRTFVPMPGGKPDEKLWPKIFQQAAETARQLAAEQGIELETPAWHQSSEWTEQEIGGVTLAGWTFTYATRPPS
jgi:hypothetical protein